MKQLTTDGIVLKRINYGEADRIVTFLTPEAGKLSVMARGVRKSKSKLAGAIELFSVSSITYVRGRGDLGTLISARLDTHYGNIVSDINRVQLGYDLLKALDRATEDQPEPEYFTLLQQTFAALHESTIDGQLIRFWFQAQLLRLAGHAPNLQTEADGSALQVGYTYSFDFDSVCFAASETGKFTASHIKFLRLAFVDSTPQLLAHISSVQDLLPITIPLIQTMSSAYIRM